MEPNRTDTGAQTPPPAQPPAAPAQPTAPATAASYPPYYPGYAYYPPYYPYSYGAPAAAKAAEPRQLRTVQAFDTAVFASYVLGASFAWSALVGAVAIAALVPTLSGSPQLRATEIGWLNGVMIARVIVWVMFGIAAILGLAAFSKLHEGRLEFGGTHERRYRELQATAALFGALVGGSGLLTFILSNSLQTSASPFDPNDQILRLRSLQDSIRLSALVWGASTAAAGFLLSNAFTRVLRDFLPEARHRTLRVIPVVFLFVPLLHAALAISFTEMAAVDTGTWTAASLQAAAESGGLAGVAAAVPILLLVRSLRAAQDRVLSGEVKSELAKQAT